MEFSSLPGRKEEVSVDMDLDNGEIPVAGDEILKAQAHIWNHIFNFINSMALKCAVELEIPDAIHRHGGRPLPLSKLVSDLRIDPQKIHCVSRLMRLLIHSGFFRIQKVNENGGEEEEEGYVLTNSSRLLLKDNPLTVTPFLLFMLKPLQVDPWQFLSIWFRSDIRTPFEIAHGLKSSEYFAGNPEERRDFNEAMASNTRSVTRSFMEKYKGGFDGVGSFVDVGGGTGTVAKAVAGAFPHIQCTVLDLPHVVADLEGTENLKYLGGDMFEEIPPADALLLKSILHAWNDEECVKILKKCREAVTSKRKKGKVIVIEMVVGNAKEYENSKETQLFYDMLMMTVVNGKERDEKEWAQLFNEAGFSDYKIFPILGLKSVIEIYP